MCAGVRAKVALMNESETKRGNNRWLLSISLFLSSSLSLVWGCRSVLITASLLRCSGGAHIGGPMNWKTSLLKTHRWPYRTHTTSSKSAKGFLPSFSLTWLEAVTHQLKSINKSTHPLMMLATMCQRPQSSTLFSQAQSLCNIKKKINK